MADLRDYSFKDWYGIFKRAVPALLLAMLLMVAPTLLVALLIWFLRPL